eukprot:759302-Prymnesium_polylepis.1
MPSLRKLEAFGVQLVGQVAHASVLGPRVVGVAGGIQVTVEIVPAAVHVNMDMDVAERCQACGDERLANPEQDGGVRGGRKPSPTRSWHRS